MRIFNQKRTKEYQLSELDLNKGRLTSGVLTVTDADGNKSKEHILVYRPTVNKTREIEIRFLKERLAKTDYQAIKLAEGELSAEEYEPLREKRRAWRARINELEALIKATEE